MFPFLVLRYPIKSLRINFLPYPCFPFLSSKYWFPLPHWRYRRANGHGPLVCCLLCVLAMATDKAACLWLAAAGQPTGGAHCIFGWKKKKDLIQNNPVLFFFTLHAKLKTVVLLKHKGFANMFRIRVRECIHRSGKGTLGTASVHTCIGPGDLRDLDPWRIWVIVHQLHLHFLGYNDYIYWIIYPINSYFVYLDTEWVVRKYVLILLSPHHSSHIT